MKILKIIIVVFFASLAVQCQSKTESKINAETEKEIIKQTLSQYLERNPNSISFYLKKNDGYKLFMKMLDFKATIVNNVTELEKIKKFKDSLNIVSDSIEKKLLTKK